MVGLEKKVAFVLDTADVVSTEPADRGPTELVETGTTFIRNGSRIVTFADVVPVL